MPRPGHLRLSEAREQWLASRRGRFSAATLRADDQVTGRFVADVGDMLVMNLQPHHVDQWFGKLLVPHLTRNGITRPPVTAVTYNVLHARLTQLFRYWQARNWTRHDLLMHTPRMKQTKRRHQQIDSDVLWQMLDMCTDPRDRAILALAMNTGCRSAEVVALKVGGLNLDKRTLQVFVQKSLVEDTMIVTDDLAAEMARWLEVYRRDVLLHQGRMLTPEDYLVPAKRKPRFTGWTTDTEGVRRPVLASQGYDASRGARRPHEAVQHALRAVGLPIKHQGLHTIRRSVARLVFDNLFDQGYDHALRTVSALLHHSDSRVTEHYLGLSAETRKRDDHMRLHGVLGPRPAAGDAVVLPLR